MSSLGRLELVPFTGRGTRILIWSYVVTIGLLAVWSLDEVRTHGPTLFGLLVLVAVGLLLTVDREVPLSLSTAIVVASVWPAVALLISWQLEVAGGQSQWFFGAGTVSMFFVSLRGRVLIGWIGFAALSLVVILWGATTETGVVAALLLTGKQAPILLVGALFTVGLKRTSATIVRLAGETSARASVEAAQLATSTERRRRLEELDAVATPLLNLLVSGRELTDADRVEFAVAEAELRDGLRARSLAVPEVAASAREARRRGVEVVLLDDRYPATTDAQVLSTVIERVVSALTSTPSGRVVARLLPEGREDVATILMDTGERQSREVI